MKRLLISTDRLQWVAFAGGLAGSLLMALNISASRYAYAVWLVGDLSWIIYALRRGIPGLWGMHLSYIAINAVGLARWFWFAGAL